MRERGRISLLISLLKHLKVADDRWDMRDDESQNDRNKRDEEEWREILLIYKFVHGDQPPQWIRFVTPMTKKNHRERNVSAQKRFAFYIGSNRQRSAKAPSPIGGRIRDWISCQQTKNYEDAVVEYTHGEYIWTQLYLFNDILFDDFLHHIQDCLQTSQIKRGWDSRKIRSDFGHFSTDNGEDAKKVKWRYWPAQ